MTLPHDRPRAVELIEAVEEMLARRVDDEPGSPHRFENRVAANALRIARQEILRAPDHAARHRRRLDDLGMADDEELTAAIRSGRLDDRWDDVVRSVREAVRDKLSVSAPGYPEESRHADR